jgi:hypothetical protein
MTLTCIQTVLRLIVEHGPLHLRRRPLSSFGRLSGCRELLLPLLHRVLHIEAGQGHEHKQHDSSNWSNPFRLWGRATNDASSDSVDNLARLFFCGFHIVGSRSFVSHLVTPRCNAGFE